MDIIVVTILFSEPRVGMEMTSFFILIRSQERTRTKYMTSQNIYRCNMNCYCVKCKKQTESGNPQHVVTKNGKHMMNGLCNIYGGKNHNLSAKNQ